LVTLEQYLRVFIDHRQKQWPGWLETTKFVYNNKIYLATKVSPFKANYSQDPQMGFERRRKEKFEITEKFVKRIRKIQKEVKAVLKKAQEEIKKYIDRKQNKEEKYKVRDLVLLNTKDFKWQMIERRLEKLTEQFVGPYRIKEIVLTNTICHKKVITK